MRNPAHCLVGTQATRRWGIFELLDQCMWISGTCYLIAREVQGEVRFGTTNILNGAQWAAAAEQALRDEGMLVIRIKPKMVQVIPKGKLEEYRKAGLVKNVR